MLDGNKFSFVESEVFIAVIMIGYILPSPMKVHRRFGGTYLLNFQEIRVSQARN